MVLKDFFSTGEAADLLKISRSSISRKFDLGLLEGKKNPVTGDRFISRESVTAMMKQYNLPLDLLGSEKRKILLGTSDESLHILFQKIFSGDERVQIERFGFGAGMLMRYLQEHPDLLIIDEELPDLPCTEVVRTLRRLEGQDEPKILCLANASSSKLFAELGKEDVVVKGDVNPNTLKDKLYRLLDIPEEHPAPNQLFQHQRQWPRITVHLPVKIEVYRRRAFYIRDLGKAFVENISCGGTYLSEMILESGTIPCEPFRIKLEVDKPPLKDWKAYGKIVRLESNGSMAAGVQFTRLSQSNLRKIKEILIE
jgi:CheY-like chemotaxis protein